MKTVFFHFPDISAHQQAQFEEMFPLYQFWNAQINVISRKDIDAFYTRHVLHALAIAKYISFKPNSVVFDVGTGGGFPGIPLAVFFPEVHFHLIDSIGKKIKVVDAVAKELGLTNVSTYNQRMESLPMKADFICCRAVAPMETLMHWVGQKIRPDDFNAIKNGLLCLKGGDLEEELINYPSAQVTDLSSYFSDSFFETKKLVYLPR